MVTVIITLYALALVAAVVCAQVRASRLVSLDWEQQVDSLKAVRVQSLRAIIALQAGDGGEHELSGQTGRTLRRVGGMEGLERLGSNARILVSLATYTEVWNAIDSSAGFQEMRMNRRVLGWKIIELKIRLWFQPNGRMAHKTLEAVATRYCDLVAALLAIYSVAHVARRDRLIAACNW